MRRKLTLMAVGLLAAGMVWAMAKPNFSGTWQLDTSRSIGLRQGMEMTLTVKHEGETIEAETKITVPKQADIIQKDTYKLDGSESDFTPAQPPNAKGKRSGQWLPRGNGFLITETVNAPGPNNTTLNIDIMRKWILSPDGNELTLDTYVDDPNGSRQVKRIFVKK